MRDPLKDPAWTDLTSPDDPYPSCLSLWLGWGLLLAGLGLAACIGYVLIYW
jgi:hypothetical protein